MAIGDLQRLGRRSLGDMIVTLFLSPGSLCSAAVAGFPPSVARCPALVARCPGSADGCPARVACCPAPVDGCPARVASCPAPVARRPAPVAHSPVLADVSGLQPERGRSPPASRPAVARWVVLRASMEARRHKTHTTTGLSRSVTVRHAIRQLWKTISAGPHISGQYLPVRSYQSGRDLRGSPFH